MKLNELGLITIENGIDVIRFSVPHKRLLTVMTEMTKMTESKHSAFKLSIY